MVDWYYDQNGAENLGMRLHFASRNSSLGAKPVPPDPVSFLSDWVVLLACS